MFLEYPLANFSGTFTDSLSHIYRNGIFGKTCHDNLLIRPLCLDEQLFISDLGGTHILIFRRHAVLSRQDLREHLAGSEERTFAVNLAFKG